MNKATSSVSQSTIEGLISDVHEHLQGLGYSSSYLRLCRGVWRKFINFSSQDPVKEAFSEDIVTRFLASCGITPGNPIDRMNSRQRMICATTRILVEFNLHGCFQRRRCITQKVKLPANMQCHLSAYQIFCKEHLRCTAGSMRCRTRYITRFLHFIDSKGVAFLTEILPNHLSDFVLSQAYLNPKTLASIVSDLRSFLRFLNIQGVVSEELSSQVPKIRVPRLTRIPSVWRQEDVDAILAAVDRSSPKGKRDYAILLLACRLGLRVGDIRTLRIEHIRWDKAQIEFSQKKTDCPLTLPMSEELGKALIDYLRYGRPVSNYREVFLKINAPIEPFSHNNNLYYIITFYRQRAGIKLPTQRLKGMHSLRHTVASRLLEAGTPLQTIADILGHLSLESTQIYTKIDIDALRTAVLDLEEVTDA